MSIILLIIVWCVLLIATPYDWVHTFTLGIGISLIIVLYFIYKTVSRFAYKSFGSLLITILTWIAIFQFRVYFDTYSNIMLCIEVTGLYLILNIKRVILYTMIKAEEYHEEHQIY